MGCNCGGSGGCSSGGNCGGDKLTACCEIDKSLVLPVTDLPDPAYGSRKYIYQLPSGQLFVLSYDGLAWEEISSDGSSYRIQSDWDETNENNPAFILNKPDVDAIIEKNIEQDDRLDALEASTPTEPVQSDWNESDTSSLTYIKNKPDIASIIAKNQEQDDYLESLDAGLASVYEKDEEQDRRLDELEAGGGGCSDAIPDDALVSGMSGEVPWYIDKELTLHALGCPNSDGSLKTFSIDGTQPWMRWVENEVYYYPNKVIFESPVKAPEDLSWMFSASRAKSIDMSKVDTSAVTTMELMFDNCHELEELDVSNFNTSNVTDMGQMFNYCSSLRMINIRTFDLSKVEFAYSMFTGCKKVEQITFPVDDLDFYKGGKFSETCDVSSMFDNCYQLTDIRDMDIFAGNTASKNLFFRDCQSLKTLELEDFDCSAGNRDMVKGCYNLRQVYFKNTVTPPEGIQLPLTDKDSLLVYTWVNRQDSSVLENGIFISGTNADGVYDCKVTSKDSGGGESVFFSRIDYLSNIAAGSLDTIIFHLIPEISTIYSYSELEIYGTFFSLELGKSVSIDNALIIDSNEDYIQISTNNLLDRTGEDTTPRYIHAIFTANGKVVAHVDSIVPHNMFDAE